MNRYKLIKTEDGTDTLYNSEYDESMHSSSGAYEESVLKHIEPSRIFLRTGEYHTLNILDVGFGLGYNCLAVICEAEKRDYTGEIGIQSFEFDRSYIQSMENIHFNDFRDDYYSIIKEAFLKGFVKYENISIQIHFGDARKNYDLIKDSSIDALFHDPFSPAKNPEMWSLEIFKMTFLKMKEDAILTTYSSAPQVRGALIGADFIPGRGPSVGKKREGTLATKKSIKESFTDDEITLFLSDPKSTPYRDTELSDLREDILSRRTEEIRYKRSSS